MSEPRNVPTDDGQKSREELLQELTHLRAQVKATERLIRERPSDSSSPHTPILEGINHIFSKALTCRTEQELGSLCLSMAEELTASRFGFIGLINDEGRVDDIAISNPGWAQCHLANPVGHRIIPDGFPIKGLYGSAITGGKSFYTNDPDRHPDRIGLPAGHPPIFSLLCVPLMLHGRSVGILAVANRDGGYADADLEALEMLAPAILQVLLSKRSEQTLAHQRELLQRIFDTLPILLIKWDPRLQFFTLNQHAEQVLGWSTAEANDGDFMAKVYPDDSYRAQVIDSMKTLQPGWREWKVATKAGGLVPIDWANLRLSDDTMIGIGVDLRERKRAEAALRESEERVSRKLESVLSPEGDLAALGLGDLIDAAGLQRLMEDFYSVAHIPMSILDIKGRILVGVGLQDICTRFHRAHPDCCQRCLESDTYLLSGLAEGQFHVYKCKNHMWNMATPIYLSGRQMGILLAGQFFFEDEAIDRDLFRAQAREYGFDEQAYMFALDQVPLLSRETVACGMSFFLKLANTISQLGYSNVKLARLLTERDRLADSLKESRATLATAIASMTDAVFISDAKGRFIDFNDAFATFYRFRNKQDCSQLLEQYQDILDVFAPDGTPVPPHRWAVPMALAGETAADAEYTLRRRDTGETWVGSYSFGPIRSAEGAIIGSVVVGRDITERKRAEEKLQESEERYRTLFESINEGFCVLEILFDEKDHAVDARYLETNPAFHRNNGLPEVIGRTALEIFPNMEHQWFEILGRVATSGRSAKVVQEFKNLGRWFQIDAFRVGKPESRRVAVLLNDITETKKAEQALRESASFYRQTLESIPGMVFTTRPDGYCDFQSQQWVDFTGIPMSEHLGNGWNRLLHPEDRTRALGAWHAAVDDKAPYDLEYRIRRHDGVYEWFRVIARPIRDDDGNIVRWFGVTMNIEKLKRAEEQLKTVNESLEQKVAERTALADARSRQLQALAVELIEAEEKERQRISFLLHEDLQQLLATAKMQLKAIFERSPDPLLENVENLLLESINKSRSISHELSPPVLQHSGLMPALKWLVRYMYDQFGVQVDLEGESVDLQADPAMKVFVFRAVQQLLMNVVKHAGVKKARIAIASSRSHFNLTVSDQGKGFDPVILKAGKKSGVLGLGLLSLRERASHIGAVFSIDSASGKGSRFTLRLPLHAIPKEPSEASETVAASSPESKERKAGKLRVLFVDDHKLMRKSLVRLAAGQDDIEIAGEASSGAEALELVRQLKPDVVVMDVSMPGMDGIEATRLIKKECPDLRVIGLSMFEDDQVSASMKHVGAEGVISKTVTPAVLLQAIHGAAR